MALHPIKYLLTSLALLITLTISAQGGEKDSNCERFVTVDGTLLNYTIYFENNSNEVATSLIIVDTLSPNLNMESFELGAASHSFDFAILDDHVICWIFHDINLASLGGDGTTNRGFVKYHIDNASEIPGLGAISNHSSIHFNYSDDLMPDFSETDKFKHFDYIVISERNELAITLDVDIAHDEIHITTPLECTEEQLTIEIFDEDGTVEFIGKLNNNHLITLDTSFLTGGKHFISVYDDHHHESLKGFVH